jgi:hypothetical protein
MSVFTKFINAYKRATPKQFMLVGVFMLAFATAIGGGFASKQMSSAAIARDTNTVNSIDNLNTCGGVGAVTPSELICDIPKRADLSGIYNNFGLQSTEYTNFSNFKTGYAWGTAKTDGTIVTSSGQVVMTNAWSIGRTKFSYSVPYAISGVGTYYKSMHTSVLKQNLPVMIQFNKDGVVDFVVLNACGNPVNGSKRTPSAECKALNATKVSENTYKFNTTVATDSFGLAKVVKVEYFIDGKLFSTQTSASTFTASKTFTQDATVSVKVTVSLPGNQTKVITTTLCTKKITVVQKEIVRACVALTATPVDNQTFRFVLTTTQGAGDSVKNATYSLDGGTGVVVSTKNTDGNITRDYKFSDFDKHTVKVTQITFLLANGTEKVVTVTTGCSASVQRNQTCENSPNLPECKPTCENTPSLPECQPKTCANTPTLPECQPKTCENTPSMPECKPLVTTGPAGTAGLFVGVSAAGAAAHRWITSRRTRR